MVLKELQGAHTGKNIVAVLLKIIKNYNIISKTDYIIADNTDNNNTIIRELESLFKNFKLDWKALYYRLRYNNYIINLTILAFLFSLYSDSQAQTQGIQAYRGSVNKIIIY